MTSPARIACPTCKRPIEWNEKFPWRPFCSERCKLVDLGNWLDGAYRIPTAERPEDVEDDVGPS